MEGTGRRLGQPGCGRRAEAGWSEVRCSHGNGDGSPDTASAPGEKSWNSGRRAPRSVWETEPRAHPTMVHTLQEHYPQKESPPPPPARVGMGGNIFLIRGGVDLKDLEAECSDCNHS